MTQQPDHDSPRRSTPSAAPALAPDELNLVLDRLVDGVMVLGLDWRIQYLNAPAAEMLGGRVEELPGKNLLAEFPDAVGHPFQVALAEAMRTGRYLRIVDYYEPFERWFESRVFPQGDRLVNLFRDVTAERRAEEELREQAEEFSEAERIVRFGVWRWDVRTRRVHWSDELHSIYGLGAGEFEGTVDGYRERVHRGDIERVWAEVGAALASRQPFAFKERIVRPDGEVRTLLSQGRVVRDGEGDVRALVGVCHDITPRVTAEQALGASELRMRSIIDRTPALITVKDLDGRYVMCNAEAEQIAEVPGGLVGKLCVDAFPASIAEAQRARDRLAVSGGNPVYDEAVLIRDGEERTFLTVTFALPDEEGLPRETCTIATDVTERRRREGELREGEVWRDRIHSALRENRMLVFGQPIYDIRGESRLASELLVRLREDGGSDSIQSPASFLPAAERFQLVQAIDIWMVSQALRHAASETTQVNISALTVCDAEAQATILGQLSAAPEAAGRLVFEITETASATQLRAAKEFAAAITERGCRLALDDFGVGFGSLVYLRSLPLSYVKIDRGFVRNLLSSADDRRVVQGIIGIANEFGLETIAEGVEDQQSAFGDLAEVVGVLAGSELSDREHQRACPAKRRIALEGGRTPLPSDRRGERPRKLPIASIAGDMRFAARTPRAITPVMWCEGVAVGGAERAGEALREPGARLRGRRRRRAYGIGFSIMGLGAL